MPFVTVGQGGLQSGSCETLKSLLEVRIEIEKHADLMIPIAANDIAQSIALVKVVG
ncbi:hypothetical protein GALL_178450 [mine drainage metagenome]|uniref:Uncharacterized protein n=1 Tax=mine drainage metagenome TaxID=410659 RepID=A0A1J5S7H3_9ZZZZ